MTLPARIRERPTRPEKRVRWDAHLRWVREHACSIKDCDNRPIEAAHVRCGTDGALSIKPGDDWTISLCSAHHKQQHRLGEPQFEKWYGFDMKQLAQEFAAKSPHRNKLRRRQRGQR